MVVKLVQPQKVLSGIDVTDEGREMLTIPLPLNAPSMLVSDDGLANMTLFNEVTP